MRSWTLPELMPGEDGEDWCRRAAASIPAENLMAAVIAYFDRRAKRKRRTPAWSRISDITGHGSGVSAAICQRFRKETPGHRAAPTDADGTAPDAAE